MGKGRSLIADRANMVQVDNFVNDVKSLNRSERGR